jgi:ppGpp synthetase/RelA/SpoT-type nucleotidyltranferase
VATALTKTQVDRLGERLKAGDISESDLQLLDAYRRTFAEAYERVIGVLRDRLQLAPTGRPAKSTTSIIDKLQREHIRLTQMQDIAGCRVVVDDIREQDRVTASLVAVFEECEVADRRVRPSHGYRAVHVIVKLRAKLVEVQIRTALQHLWAEMSEKVSDMEGLSVKYGGGSDATRSILEAASAAVARKEEIEQRLNRLLLPVSDETSRSAKLLREAESIRDELTLSMQALASDLRGFIELVEGFRRDET